MSLFALMHLVFKSTLECTRLRQEVTKLKAEVVTLKAQLSVLTTAERINVETGKVWLHPCDIDSAVVSRLLYCFIHFVLVQFSALLVV